MILITIFMRCVFILLYSKAVIELFEFSIHGRFDKMCPLFNVFVDSEILHSAGKLHIK